MLSIILIAEDVASIKKFFAKIKEENISIEDKIFTVVRGSDPSLLLALEKENVPISHVVFGNGKLSIGECINKICSMSTKTEFFLVCPDNSLITLTTIEKIKQKFSNPDIGLVIPRLDSSDCRDKPVFSSNNKNKKSNDQITFRLHDNSVFCFSKTAFEAANGFDVHHTVPFFSYNSFDLSINTKNFKTLEASNVSVPQFCNKTTKQRKQIIKEKILGRLEARVFCKRNKKTLKKLKLDRYQILNNPGVQVNSELDYMRSIEIFRSNPISSFVFTIKTKLESTYYKLKENRKKVKKYGISLFLKELNNNKLELSAHKLIEIDPKTIPIFILSFNRLKALQKLLERLEKLNIPNPIIIVDNNSTLPSLVAFLASTKHKVVRLKKNYGHLALWKAKEFRKIINQQPFILTDPDVLPSIDCPSDFISLFYEQLRKYPFITKVGFSLRLDTIPINYAKRDEVLGWEQKFWNEDLKFVTGNEVNRKLYASNSEIREAFFYFAPIDTTFALYRPGIYPTSDNWWNSLRAAPPYTADHLGWFPEYIVEEEMKCYHRGFKNRSSHWLK